MSTLGKRVDDAKRCRHGAALVHKAVVTFSFRKIDSIKTIEGDAEANQIDVDGNALDATETAMHRFDRELAELDADGDGKIFGGEEMEKYVFARARAKATTAHISVWPTPGGAFEAARLPAARRPNLDAEIKSATKSLQKMAACQ